MANIMDYMQWRGDLTFSAVPFCEVDNLIFSKLTFLNLQQILPPYGSGASTTVGEAARLYRIETDKKEAQALAEKLKTLQVKIPASSGADGRLYGSVTSKDIVERLKAETGIDIDKRKVVMGDPIKAYGKYEVEVKLYPEVNGKINVLVCEK